MTDKTAREILREWSFVERCGHYPHTEVEKPCPHCDGTAHTILAALEAGGFAVVPKEPGDDVRKAMYATWDSFGDDATMVRTLTRAQYFDRIKEMGQQRTAILTCMTCSDTARRHGAWEDDPRGALQREINWETGWRRKDNGDALRDELLAIAALIENHRAEFDEHIALTARRREWNEKKAALSKGVKEM